jgi:hypothetical protein
MNFKPNVTALEKICVPFKMNEDYESWLRIVPNLYYCKTKEGSIFTTNGNEMQYGNTDRSTTRIKFDLNKNHFEQLRFKQITANIIAVSTYNDASKIMKKKFRWTRVRVREKSKSTGCRIWHKTVK